MNLTQLIRKFESQLKGAEKLARHYNNHADDLRQKLASVATIVGESIASSIAPSKAGAPRKGRRKARRMSAAGRARIIAAQKKRWAAFRSKSKVKAPARKKARRKLSAAGRANIIAAQKKRWAAQKRS